MLFTLAYAVIGAVLLSVAKSQQYAGDFINTTLPGLPGAEIAYWKIRDGTKGSNLTLINYINHGSDGQRLVPAKLKRAVIIIHGLNRDPGTYESNMLSALAQLSDKDINTDSVAIVAPFFANGDDKTTGGYPWVNGLKAGQGSITNCLVWSGSQWSAGGVNQYPWTSSKNVSSYAVLDQMLQYFDNKTMFPNINQLVVAGHSLGGQTSQRYAAIGQPGNLKTPVSYWVANPNSYAWFSTDRPLSTSSCSTFDNYREGYTNFSQYPMTYGLNLVSTGRSSILANFNSKAINYARGTLDLGDDSSSCAPGTTGANRNERFFNFIKAFPPSCTDPTGNACDTVDFVASGHDGGAMMASTAGQARLFTDNFYGDGSRSYDFGYPRQQTGDDPFPNPALNLSTAAINNNTYAGHMTYWGCWSDQSPTTLTNMAYQGLNNTIESCAALCASTGNTIAGMENGDQCFCGSSLGYLATQVIDSSCATACTGNSAETCGGARRLSLFSAGRPSINAAPGTPEVVGNDWNYKSCSIDNAGGLRALGDSATSSASMTLEMCGNFCQGSQYFGTEYGSECYCGNSLSSSSSIAAANDCNMLCSGDNTEFCGSGNRLTVYQNTSWVASSKVSTSSAASSTPTATGPSCPDSDAKTVTSKGKTFTVECGIDHAGGDLTSLSVSNFQGCIDACAQNSQCVDVSLSGSACYLKSTLGSAVNNAGVWGAKLMLASASSQTSTTTLVTTTGATSGPATTVLAGNSTTSTTPSTPSSSSASATSTTSSASSSSTAVAACPSSDATTIISNGKSFVVECGVDHAEGDLTSLGVSNFQQCIDACAQNSACVDVSLSGSACYLKSSVGTPVNNGVWGARLLASATTLVVSSTTATVTLSSLSLSSFATSTSTQASYTATATSSASKTSSQTSSTTSASSTPSAVSCPGSNSTTYLAGGQSWLIECGIDHAAGDMGSLSVSSFADCIAACASTTGCVDVSLSGSACYLKSSVGTPVQNGVWGARAIPASSSVASLGTLLPSTSSSSVPTATIATSSSTSSPGSTTFATSISTSTSSTASATPTSLSCPASNSTLYTAPSGNTFLIECGIDHAGGDMSWGYVSSFTQCIDSCDSTTGCVDVSLSGVACYRKKTLGAASSNGGVWGAKLISSVQ